ncbi:CRISPR-associated protein, Cas5e family [Rubellimicrobium thermophilum DSM 16684]|uniref:CRISPR-associated protein, Cas5e family n=1 Tax=Rubellimicrobium thermophilum DSM 16684 TaxID=1123069 RepID=S9QXN0_9RHOB|nr:type I-E CRISPR-associated protein Cas5/CasD [Rubellimicrobium thermophilum]EPX84372.1 CRISPR-associated protein, Cas5e family [Rubellimicrobium thermophilum DSM 16684]
MPEHLIFTLSAAFAGFGDVAGHERRGSWTWPGRSAVLGLLAAAQGIRRDGDFAALDALRLAVAVFDTGAALRDYHTVQTVPSAVIKRPQSRPAALRRAGKNANTTISHRDYRAGVLYGVAVAGPGLPALAAALEAPAFHLYLGRKACPLNAPLAPRIVAAETPEAALCHLRLPPWAEGLTAQTLYADDGPAERVETRHDAPLDRRLWHFAPRAVAVRSVHIAPKEAA